MIRNSAIEKNQRLLVEAQEVAHIGIWDWNLDEPVVNWSSVLYRIYGVTPQEYTPSYAGYLQKVHPDDRERVRHTLERVFKEHISFSLDEQILRPDGSIRHLHTWGHPVLDSHGKLIRMIGVCQDVTERKLAEEKLHQSEERYRSIVETAEEGIWLINEESITVFVNQKMADMFGYTVDEMIGKHIFFFMNEEQQVKAKIYLARRRQGLREHFDFNFYKKDGSKIWTTIATNPLYGKNGKYSGALAVVNEITQRKEMEILLTAQRDIFEFLATSGSLTGALDILVRAIETIMDGVIASVLLLDEEGKHLLIGAAPNLPDAYNRAVHGSAIGPAAGCCGTSAYRGELVIVEDIEKDPLWVDYRQMALPHGLRACWSHPIFSKDCKVLGTFAMYFHEVRRPKESELQLVRDVTSAAALAIQHMRTRDSLAKALIESQKSVQLREDFIAIASHELRTPLTPLKMQAQLMKRYLAEGIASDPAKIENLKNLATGVDWQTDRLSKLTDDLLNAARIGASELLLDRQECDLSKIVQDVVKLYAEEIKKAKCRVELQIEPHVVGKWDQLQLERVVVNLLSNSLKYGCSKPIEISVMRKDKMAIFQVRDQGIGITKEDQSKLFERFQRAASLRHYGGLGLGLYISQEIVRAHGGTIQLKSELGQGSCFTVKLPL
jgi:PAS domain S-box-containing protein